MHEDLTRAPSVKLTRDRTFGYVMAGAFALIACSPLLHRPAGALHAWALVISAAFAVTAALRPGALKPLNILWTRFGILLHRIVSPLVLVVIFFAVVTPVGMLIQLFGKDPLRLRPSPSARSYWIERKPGSSPQSMQHQF
jgi:hypothetical protein